MTTSSNRGAVAFARFERVSEDFRTALLPFREPWVSVLDDKLALVYGLTVWPTHGGLHLEYVARPFADRGDLEQAAGRQLEALLTAWDDGFGLGLSAWRSGIPEGWAEAAAAAAPAFQGRVDTYATDAADEIAASHRASVDAPEPNAWQQLKTSAERAWANRQSSKRCGGGRT